MIETANDLFEEELRDVYDAEKQLVKALPKMAKAAMSDELRQGFEEHLEQTKGHVQRLEQVFQSIEVKPKGKTCEAMKGLVEEGQQAIDENEKSEMRDIMMIGAAKRVEHYEMAAYQSLIMIAESTENEAAVELLRETLSEEEETDQKLSSMCEEFLGGLASAGDQESADEDSDEVESRPARSAGNVKTRKAG
ncbi:MAG: hypothetical protein JWP63_6170 [Candidatus Solibacter sp.]|jgi:ferritin-like metal-binding protein YciE|nr:hypothetical protein [Candidatus Solibacter sp.]